MPDYIDVVGLRVASELHQFVAEEALPGSGVDQAAFWAGAAEIINELTPRNRELLARRDELQQAVDDYHRRTPGRPAQSDYAEFLTSIGYLLDEPAPFTITTDGVDDEIATQAGPQLVVPLLNARYAVNAANARWGSLYDALYGSDVIDETDGKERAGGYNPTRGAAVIARVREILDRSFPLASGSHADATRYAVDADGLVVTIDGAAVRLADPALFVGFRGEGDEPTAVLLTHHGLHIEIQVDRNHPVGAGDRAGVSDVVVEAAVTTIMDLEDSVAAVDAADKVLGYRNWLQLMQRRLTAEVDKGGRAFTRVLAADREYTTADGGTVTLPGRSMLLIRQVGLLMTTDAVLDRDGRPVPEGILDALVTGLGSVHDLRGDTAGGNSRTGSAYVVKPKMHGPDEVAFTVELMSRVERLLQLPPATIKLGIMDEERRTSVNLRRCVYEARDRVVFINTGFLDRTGDEIHTSMLAGPMVRKAAMREATWIRVYEDNNVDAGLALGFPGRAQIGKGMWAAPDNLADMMTQKIGHPLAGASCAWVPSPTAAALHALHYHEVSVADRQRELAGRRPADRLELLTVPLAEPAAAWSPEEVAAEVDNNVQGVLGYVVRWVELGIGCSKVPDLTGTPLMEDRATCRISSQHVANWLRHGIVSREQVEESLRRMAALVDAQNAGEPGYRPMAPAFEELAFAAARALLLEGADQPNGYTEPLLHEHRRAQKNKEMVRS
ncbi:MULTISPECIES: malate synthase G [unclassified Parafrankia]|uniref:malate synthase G n=1 Tax=unclassified Parafrankia TaxID=2994368 RepID=UPI000DA57B43|nr:MULTISPECIES: malate synthase G [unclassified Parafrankia]TCJ35067.1 malate synthase G [Parafrankia sp. BMG5.11]SQE00077.1 malate synthase G [Parafrankia sp. Ea1.12]